MQVSQSLTPSIFYTVANTQSDNIPFAASQNACLDIHFHDDHLAALSATLNYAATLNPHSAVVIENDLATGQTVKIWHTGRDGHWNCQQN